MPSDGHAPTTDLPIIDAARLRHVLDGRWAEARDEARAMMVAEPLPVAHELTNAAYREAINDYTKRIAQEGRPGLLQLVAKGLLTDFRDEFGSLDPLGMVRYAADRVFGVVVENTAARLLIQSLIDAVPRREEEVDVRDRGWHLELLEWREAHVLEGAALRLKKGVDDGLDMFEVFNSVQDHVLLAAQAHIDRVVLEQFVAGIAACEDPEVRAVLDRLCDLHALSLIERDRGWFLEHGRLTGRRSKAIITVVNDLCAELRPHARTLVDAFGIPEEVIVAPIARGEEAHRQQLRRQAAEDVGTADVDALRG